MEDGYDSYQQHYDENDFWEKLRRFARKAGIKVSYAALLLFYVLKSPMTTSKDRAKIIGALGYFILPIRTTWPPWSGACTASSRASPRR